MKESEAQLRRDSVQELFKGYYYNKHDLNIAPEPSAQASSTLATTGQQMTTKPKETMENEPVLLKGKGFDDVEIQEEKVKGQD